MIFKHFSTNIIATVIVSATGAFLYYTIKNQTTYSQEKTQNDSEKNNSNKGTTSTTSSNISI